MHAFPSGKAVSRSHLRSHLQYRFIASLLAADLRTRARAPLPEDSLSFRKPDYVPSASFLPCHLLRSFDPPIIISSSLLTARSLRPSTLISMPHYYGVTTFAGRLKAARACANGAAISPSHRSTNPELINPTRHGQIAIFIGAGHPVAIGSSAED